MKPLLIVVLIALTGMGHANGQIGGGALARANFVEWMNASNEDRVETSGHWVIEFSNNDPISDPALFRIQANNLAVCITQLIPTLSTGYNPYEAEVASVSLICANHLRKNNWMLN